MNPDTFVHRAVTVPASPDTVVVGVVVAVPEPWAQLLVDWRAKVGDPQAQLVPPHVTLLPPTEVPREARPEITTHLGRVAAGHPPFDVHLQGTGTFRPVSPVVFVSLARGIADCERIEAKVRSGPLTRTTSFPYHPHVTVAHDLDEPQLDEAFEALASYDASFPVWGFTLFEQGPDRVWRPQRDFRFGAGGMPGPVEPPA